MSVTYSMFCEDHKKELWIGQGRVIYWGEKITMQHLQQFLFEHERCHLTFRPDGCVWREGVVVELMKLAVAKQSKKTKKKVKKK